jgi:hypothetical protein
LKERKRKREEDSYIYYMTDAVLPGMKRVRGRGCGIYIIWEEGGGWRRGE